VDTPELCHIGEVQSSVADGEPTLGEGEEEEEEEEAGGVRGRRSGGGGRGEQVKEKEEEEEEKETFSPRSEDFSRAVFR